MKILIVGDTHFRTKSPKRRKDEDFMQTCLDKFGQVLDIFHEYECDAIIQVGDFFDNPDPSKALLAELIRELRKLMVPVGSFEDPILFAIHGQHDLSYHSEASAKRSALKVMEAAGVLGILNYFCKTFINEDSEEIVDIYGADFGQEVPIVSGIDYKVLVSHAMVGDKPLWPGQELTGPDEYVENHPGYDLYCLGDYHYPFSKKVGEAWVINPGCLIRMKANERELAHKPKVVLFDTEIGKPQDIYLDVKPVDEIFDLTDMDNKTKVDWPDFDALVRKLQDTGKIGVSFKENLQIFFDKEKTPENVRNIVWKALDEV